MPANGHRLYIGNIGDDARERDIEKFFKGYGYDSVEFDDYRDADDAVQDLDGKDMNGARVRVEFARDPRDRRGFQSRGGRSPVSCIC